MGAVRNRWIAAVVASLSAGAALWFAGVAGASVVTTSVTFSYTGAAQTFAVPAGVSSVHVVAIGALGGDNGTASVAGGLGQEIQGDLSVTAGSTLTVLVGGEGGNATRTVGGAGGFNGGAAGGPGFGSTNGSGGGGGGGASEVDASNATRLLVAAGGGGGGSDGNTARSGGAGGNAGAAGASGTMPVDNGGGGGAGTPSAGGTSGQYLGTDGCGANGVAGSAGSGGAGASGLQAVGLGGGGGGGGGGLFGGGGGSGTDCGGASGGGGGGSSLVPSGASPVQPTTSTELPRVTITYSGPPPTASSSTQSLSFGSQAQSTVSPGQAVTITDTGSAPLIVSGVSFEGASADDFFVAMSTCGGQVARTATLEVISNDPGSPTDVSLSGTGGQLPQGPTGQSGAPGQTGATGPVGPRGPAGKIELVVCNKVTKTVGSGKRKHKVTVQKCTTRLVSGTVKFTIDGDDLGASVGRGGVTYATGFAIPAGADRWQLVLTRHLRRLRPGRYTLTLRTRRGQPRVVARRAITIT
jgi:hypothetical protein